MEYYNYYAMVLVLLVYLIFGIALFLVRNVLQSEKTAKGLTFGLVFFSFLLGLGLLSVSIILNK